MYVNKHPKNDHAWIADSDMAALRYIQAETHLSTSMLPLVMGLFYSFYFRQPAPPSHLVGCECPDIGSSLAASLCPRCDLFVRHIQRQARTFLYGDGRHYTDVELHQIQLATIHPETGKPEFFLGSVLMGFLQKSAESNASENLNCLDVQSIQ
jgi:hypothetical protein